MQKTGIITNLVSKGGYDNSRGDHIYTFWMGIDTDAGIIKGEIGSKSETYPKGIGDEITVDVTSSQEHGNKFKAVNPQYSGGGQQGSGGGGQKKDVDWDAIAEGKVRHGIVCAGIASGQIVVTCKDHVNQWTDYIMGRDASMPKGNANPDHVGDDPPPPADDGIPF